MDTSIDKKDILDFLNQHNLAVLSTVNKDGLPDAAPIYFLVENTFDIFFITPTKTQKNINVHLVHDVALTVVDEKNRATVQIRGTTEEHKEVLLDVLMRLGKKIDDGSDFVRTLPFFQHKDQSKTVIRIRPTEIRMRKYSDHGMEEKQIDIDSLQSKTAGVSNN